MDEEQGVSAYQMGRSAYKNGIPAPVMDKAFMETLNAGPVGTNLEPFREWTRGWHDANLERVYWEDG
jgi:hypothetical protein